jgi:hypothetical protein
VLDERKLIAADQYDLLFAPSMSHDAFVAQLEAIHHRDIDLLWRLKTEVEFFMTAVYGVLSMARAIRRSSAGELNGCVQQAIAAFEKAAPDTDLLRHIHVHLDAYMRGEGLAAARLPDPTESGAVAMLDDGPVYWVGGKLFVITEIAAATGELARAVAACGPAG